MKMVKNKTICGLILIILFLCFTQRQAFAMEIDTDRPGMDYKNFDLPSPQPELCRQACIQDQQCKAFTYVKPNIQGRSARCWLKSGVPNAVRSSCCISGVKASKEDATPIPLPGPKQDATPIPLPGPKQPKPDATPIPLPKPKPDATPIPLPGPQSSMKPLNQEAVARIDSMAHFEKNWRPAVKKVLGDLRNQTTLLQEDAFKQSLQQLNMRFQQDSSALKKTGYVPEYIKKLMPHQQAIVEPKTQIQTGGLMKSPKITGVFSLGATEAAKTKSEIKSGGFIEITGENFGDCGSACGIRIEYLGERKEFSKEPPPQYIKELMPVGGVWSKSWGDKNIIAQVPNIPEWPISPSAKIVVWRGGQQSFAISQVVKLIPNTPGINYIVTAPQYGDGESNNAITSGGEFLIYGSGFGDKPGQIYLELTEPIKVAQKIDPPIFQTIKTIDLTPLPSDWTDNIIRVKVPKFKGNYLFQQARLYVKNPSAAVPAMINVRFGPRMMAFWVPGTSFLTIDYGKKNKPATIEKEGNILKVTHSPDCGLSGTEGIDRFFHEPKNLPKGTKLLRAMIKQIDPKTTDNWESWLINNAMDMFKACFSGELFSCVKEAAQLMFYKLFDSKAGSYVVRVDDFSKPNAPYYTVHWENSCSGPYDGVPNIYVASFLVFAPEWSNIE